MEVIQKDYTPVQTNFFRNILNVAWHAWSSL
jgi:hypothetical protein